MALVNAQVPPRLQIPGALPRTQNVVPRRLSRPAAFTPREVKYHFTHRVTQLKWFHNLKIRPVSEEVEEPNYPSVPPSPTSAFDDEVNKLGFSLQNIGREEEEGEFFILA